MAIPPEVNNFPKYNNIKIIKIGCLHNILWEHISFPRYVKKNKAISLNLCNVAPLINPGIVCIHDMKIKVHPEYFNKKFKIWYSILFLNQTKRAKKIITVSEFSKKEIVKYYNVSSSRIVVIPNAWQHYNKVDYDENTLVKYGLEKSKFYFAMGSMDPNKNFKWIIKKAIENPNEMFVIAGAINKNVFSQKGLNLSDNIKLLGFIKDEEAKTLMRDCKAFLFPSIYEGFGIPPLEAMSAGCQKIIVSDTEVMHEIFNESVEYIDKNNKINPEYDLILSKYSWTTSAQILKKICEEFL